MKQKINIFGLAIVIFSWAGLAASESQLTVVDRVDLNRYLGMWYEIAINPPGLKKAVTVTRHNKASITEGSYI